MDISHLVHARRFGIVRSGVRRLSRSPALHFAVLGLVLFLGSQHRGTSVGAGARRPLVIPVTRLTEALLEFESIERRPATVVEKERLLRRQVDQEILFQYALDLGLAQEPVAERRLAQVAAFVTDNPQKAGLGPQGTAAQAAEALALGLHQGDKVVRRILIDGARRVIREPILLREPTEEALAIYLEAHGDDFLRPEELRITQVILSHSWRREHPEAEAQELLTRLRRERVAPEDAAKFGDGSMVPSHLPLLPERDIERRLGHRFVQQLAGLSTGFWHGPVSSHFGSHLVFIHQRLEPRIAALEEVQDEVRNLVRQQLADQWLAFRLDQLRSSYFVPDFERMINPGERTS